MNKVTAIRRILAATVAAATIAIPATAANAAPVPVKSVLWSQHTRMGAGGVDVTSPEVTIPAINSGSIVTSWYFLYRWHCKPGVYATPVAYYTTSDGQTIPLVADRWAVRDHSLRFFPDAATGTTLQVHWRMDIGTFGHAVGSGGLCGHTFRIVQS